MISFVTTKNGINSQVGWKLIPGSVSIGTELAFSSDYVIYADLIITYSGDTDMERKSWNLMSGFLVGEEKKIVVGQNKFMFPFIRLKTVTSIQCMGLMLSESGKGMFPFTITDITGKQVQVTFQSFNKE